MAKKTNKNRGLIIGGVLIGGGLLAWYLIKRKRDRDALALMQSASVSGTTTPTTTTPTTTPSYTGTPIETDKTLEWASNQPVLKKGDRNAAVETLQKWLNVSSDPKGTFGDATLGAVKQYQNAKYLTPDGIVGKNTWYKLAKDYQATQIAILTAGLPSWMQF